MSAPNWCSEERWKQTRRAARKDPCKSVYGVVTVSQQRSGKWQSAQLVIEQIEREERVGTSKKSEVFRPAQFMKLVVITAAGAHALGTPPKL